MKIEWVFDREEPIDLENLLGDLSVSDADSTITVQSTYIDSWFVALIRGLRILQDGRSGSVEILEEPSPLVFELSEGKVWISYEHKRICAESLHEFQRSLHQGICWLTEQIKGIPWKRRYEILSEIQEYSDKHINLDSIKVQKS